jgi:rhodanese-related sulfurtransferase
MSMDDIEHLTPQEMVARLASDVPPIVIDVRETWEYEIAHVPNSTLVPLNTLPGYADGLDRGATYALLCHHGMRSEMAARWMAQHGFTHLINIDGGIDAWSTDVDPSLSRY